MIRVFVFFAVVFLIAIGGAWLADRPGEVMIDWQGYRIEISLMTLAISIAVMVMVGLMLWSILPNILGPLLVIMTVDLASAILLEATLSFLGIGLPADSPSLGTLIRIGMGFLLSGEWWILWVPTLFLVALVVSINILGDFLRDVFNPRLR